MSGIHSRVEMKSAAAVIAFAAVSAFATSARAQNIGDIYCDGLSCYEYEGEQVCTQPNFVGVNAGDAILYPVGGGSTSCGNDGICQLFQAAELSYTHVALVYNSMGEALAESYWDTNPPPSTHSTGGDHYCSRILDSARLQSLNPGAGAYADTARTVNWAIDFPNMGTPYCNAPADGYHFNSFIHDDVQGGSCEKFLVDFCGVPVQQGDKAWISPDALNAGLEQVYNYAYNGVLGITSGLPWIDFAACGGVDATIMSQRGAFQVTNEIRWKWYELQMPDGDSTDTLGIDTNAEGINGPWGWENLGAGSQNTQWTGDVNNPTANTTFGSYCTDVNTSNQTPGGYLQGEGASCPSWQNYGNWLQANVPDNVANAAGRMGIEPTATQVNPSYCWIDGEWVYLYSE
jgi:hypothetical protein